MNLLITSSVEKTIAEAAKTATELGTGLEISRFPHLEKIDDDFNSIITEMKDGISDFDGIVTLHALFSGLNPGVSDKALKEVVNIRYQQSFEAAMAVGAKHVNFHSGHKGMHHRVSIEKNCQTSIKFWKEYIKQFEDNGVVAVLENVLDFDYEHIKTIVDEVNSPFLKVCLDTGHANLCSTISPQDWIKTYGDRLQHMHLHNNFKTNDDHNGIKYGTVNFLGIVDTLKSENLNPYIVFEIFDKKELVESVEIFKNLCQ
ncbi:MAG: sugar phosphate isomerase/epimerase family protein [bacterium]|nr:sugar phosphate isomerase/epimerase family protein [bacterium]